jgi:hypothetical protein
MTIVCRHFCGTRQRRRETCWINPFQAKRLAAFDRIKKINGGPVIVTHQQQSDDFVGHVFNGEEMPPFAELLLKPCSMNWMISVISSVRGNFSASLRLRLQFLQQLPDALLQRLQMILQSVPPLRNQPCCSRE